MEGKDNKIESNALIKVNGKLMDLSVPRIMGIINVNEDSFYQGSRVIDDRQILRRVEQFVKEGAEIIDIGGISTRPGADLFTVEEELARVIPCIEQVRKQFPDVILSIDTFRSKVALAAVNAGVSIINDVYGGRYDDNMFPTVASTGVPYILMHSRGDSSNMQMKTSYENLVQDVVKELSDPLVRLRELGVLDVIIDPGFGFAKTVSQNYELLKSLCLLETLNCPLLVGVSRKSMIYKKLGISPAESLNGTTILNTLAVLNGAGIIRVHDAREAYEIKRLLLEN